MASTTLNLAESLSPSDALTKSVSPTRYTVNAEDDLALVDTISEIHTQRYTKSIEDGLAIGDIVDTVYQYRPIFNLTEVIVLDDEFNESHTIRTVLPLDDILTVSDSVVIVVNNRVDLDFEDIVGLVDLVVARGTNRIGRSFTETIVITEEFAQDYGIKVVDGTIDGESLKSFPVNASGALLAVTPFNWIFIRWTWKGGFKIGIQNLYKPSTTLIVPIGGGEIIANFFNIGTIDPDSKSLVFVLDIFDFEYIEDPDGDYILTKETITAAGDSMGVAKTNLTIEQGSSFLRVIIYQDSNGDPVDLTGYTAEMQIRKTKESGTILLTLNTSNGYLILGGAAGTVTISIPASVTETLDFVWGRYDLELYPAGDTAQAVRLLEGKVNLSKQVTQ